MFVSCKQRDGSGESPSPCCVSDCQGGRAAASLPTSKLGFSLSVCECVCVWSVYASFTGNVTLDKLNVYMTYTRSALSGKNVSLEETKIVDPLSLSMMRPQLWTLTGNPLYPRMRMTTYSISHTHTH